MPDADLANALETGALNSCIQVTVIKKHAVATTECEVLCAYDESPVCK